MNPYPLIKRLGLEVTDFGDFMAKCFGLDPKEVSYSVVKAEDLERVLSEAMKVKGWPEKYLGAPDIWMWTDGDTQAPGVKMHEALVVGIQEIAPKQAPIGITGINYYPAPGSKSIASTMPSSDEQLSFHPSADKFGHITASGNGSFITNEPKKLNEARFYIELLLTEVEALRSVLSEFEGDKLEYLQMVKANNCEALRNSLVRP